MASQKVPTNLNRTAVCGFVPSYLLNKGKGEKPKRQQRFLRSGAAGSGEVGGVETGRSPAEVRRVCHGVSCRVCLPQGVPQCLASARAVFAHCLCNACSDAGRGLLRLRESFRYRVENTHFAEKGGIRGGGHEAWVEDAHGGKTQMLRQCPTTCCR